jgi:hypothetical protein
MDISPLPPYLPLKQIHSFGGLSLKERTTTSPYEYE